MKIGHIFLGCTSRDPCIVVGRGIKRAERWRSAYLCDASPPGVGRATNPHAGDITEFPEENMSELNRELTEAERGEAVKALVKEQAGAQV